jgi:nucleoside-diphosphate-sugar epimerase
MKKIVITGTAGLLGPYVVEHFLEQGYEVLSVDKNRPANPLTHHISADLTDLGQCYGILANAYAVVHLAAIPNPNLATNDVTFKNNVMGTYNILEACAGLGITKAVIASSECAYGICNTKHGLTPAYIPMDEDHPLLPEDCYGLGKVVGEVIADSFHNRCGMQIVSFRIGNIMSKEKYLQFPGFIHDTARRKHLMWNYIDARDIATACRLAIEKDGLGSVVMNLAADDNCMEVKSCDLMKAEYPDVTDVRSPIDGYQSLYSSERAKQLLGWKPVHFWRGNVPKD